MKEIWFWMARNFAELLCPLSLLALLVVVWFVSDLWMKVSRWWKS